MKKNLVATLAAVSLLSAAACANGATGGGGGDGSNVLVVGTTQAPTHLNPAVQSGLAVTMPGGQLFASPVRLDNDFEPQPYLAESWEVSEDGKTVTLQLVEDAVFHDGEPITSDDVAFSLNTVKAEHPFGRSLYGPVKSVDTPDEHTAVINLSHPHPALMIAMSPPFLPVLPEHVYGDSDPVAEDPNNTNDVVGSGPFQVKEYTAGERIHLEKFDDFFIDDAPALDELIFETIPDENTMVLELEKGGEVNMIISGAPSTFNRLGEIDGIKVADTGYEVLGTITWLEFNTKRPQLQDKQVRQAIAYAVDTEYVIDELHQGLEEEAPSPIHPSSPYFYDDIKRYDRDVDEANRLLDAAGFPEDANGTRFKLTLDYIPGSDEMQKNVAEVVRTNLADVGVDVTLRAAPDFPTWAERVGNHNFDMSMDNVWNWGDPVVGVERTYRCDNIVKGVVWANMSQYCNEEVDRYLAEGAQATNEQDRLAAYIEAQKLLAEDLPVYWMETLPNRNAYRDNVQNPPDGIFGMVAPMLDTQVD